MKLTEELEKIVTARAAMWDPEGDNIPELLTVIDGKLTVVVVAGIRDGFTDLGRALAPLAEELAGRVTEYALIYTGRTRDVKDGSAGEWVVCVYRGNADGHESRMGDVVMSDGCGRVPDALAKLVA